MQYNYRYLQYNLQLPPEHFQALLITGPRRSGKSTFSLHIQKLWGGGSYVTFDTPLEQVRFKEDPEGFFLSLKTPAVLDEVQNVPEIFNYLKAQIDKNPHKRCSYILTGSQQFQMMRHVSESLAGRILIRELHPFCLAEILQTRESRIKKNIDKILNSDVSLDLDVNSKNVIDKSFIAKALAQGGFPQVVLAPSAQDQTDWFNAYVETYVQRDVRALSNVQDLAKFSRFVTLVAGRSAQIINYSELGKDIGINYKTSQHYLSLLETSYLWKSMPPFFKAGSEKRLSKSHKGIFADSGLAMFLLGLHANSVQRNPLFGALFESFIIMEMTKLFAAFGHRVNLLHFRTGEKHEVDVVIEQGLSLIPIEIKCSSTIDSTWGKGIKVFRKVVGQDEKYTGFILSLHPEIKQLPGNVWNIPLATIC